MTESSWLADRSPNGIIDCYVNGNPPVAEMGEYVSKAFFSSTIADRTDVHQLVELMDANDVTWALLAPPPETTMEPDVAYRWAREAVQAYPDRFGLTGRVDPAEGMAGVRRLEAMVKNDGLVAVRFAPYRLGRPPSDRRFYPLFTKCVELDLPITVLSGMNVTARGGGYHQHPSHYDIVCEEWPELTIVTAHGCMPWAADLVALMRKWPNLHHTLSAMVPSRYPAEIVEYLGTRGGREKVLFASDYPIIDFTRAIPSLQRLTLPHESWEPFLYGNADRIFRSRAKR